MHLRDPHRVRDLRLRQTFVEAQADDLAFALGQPLEQVGDHAPIVALVEADLVVSQEGLAVGGAVVVGTCCVDRADAVCSSGGETAEYVVAVDVQVLGQLVDGRAATVLLRQFLVARRMARWSSFADRGTRTVQVRSRKYRLSSPSIVVAANDENAAP